MSAADNNDVQGSWVSILLIYAIGVLGATTISQAITVARDTAAFFHAPQQAGWIISIPSALVVVGALMTGWLVAFVQTGLVSTLPYSWAALYGVAFAKASSAIPHGMIVNCIGCWAVGPLMNRGVGTLTLATVGALGEVVAGIAAGSTFSDFGTAIAVACAFFFAPGLIAGLLWLVIRRFSSTGARNGVAPRISVAH